MSGFGKPGHTLLDDIYLQLVATGKRGSANLQAYSYSRAWMEAAGYARPTVVMNHLLEITLLPSGSQYSRYA